jgi:thioredoxin
MSQTITIDSPSHFTTILNSNRIVVVDFYADWCGPCKAIAPIYEQLSSQLSRPGTLAFTKVNTDSQKQIAQTYNITAMPTFMVFKSGRESKRIKGADVKALDAAVKQLAQEASSAPSGSGSGSGGDPFTTAGGGGGGGGTSKNWIGASLPRGYEDVTEAVDQLNLDFLNLDDFRDGQAQFAGGKGQECGGQKGLD